jgi:sodium-coupled neutral amino acid transporter 11
VLFVGETVRSEFVTETMPIQHRSTVDIGEAFEKSHEDLSLTSLKKPMLKRAWSISSPKERKFSGVEPGDFMKEARAQVFTSSNLRETNKVIGGFHSAIANVAEFVAPMDALQEEDPAKDGLQTNGEAMLNLLNNCLGSGMLGMGFCIAQTGVLMGMLVMIFSALVNKKTLMLNLKCSRWAGVKPASTEVGDVAMGRTGQLLLVLMVVLMGFFCMVSYVDACADAIIGILSVKFETKELPPASVISIICWVFLLVPPTLIRSMSAVAMLSFIAFIGGMTIVVSLSVVCIMQLASTGLPVMTGEGRQIRLFPADVSGFLNAFPILVLVFSVQAGGDVVLVTMKDASTPNMEKVVNRTYGMVLVMLYFIGVLCYITFLDDTKGDVLKNFSATSIPGIIARVASLDLVVLSFMIMIIPCRVALLDLVFGKNEALQESTKAEFYGVTMVLNVLALGMALAVSDLSLVLGLDGAICTNFVAFLLPVAFWLKIQAHPVANEEAVPVFSCRNVVMFAIFTIGFMSLVLSTAQILRRFMQ